MEGTQSLSTSGRKGGKVVLTSMLPTISVSCAAQDAVGKSGVTSWRG